MKSIDLPKVDRYFIALSEFSSLNKILSINVLAENALNIFLTLYSSSDISVEEFRIFMKSYERQFN